MQFVRLGEAYTSQYLPDLLIEKYNSLIFTERFAGNGEFTLTTPHIDETMALLPEDTLVSHLETDEVMMVESHTITQDPTTGADVLKVYGTQLPGFLNHRHVEGPYQKKRSLSRDYTPGGAALSLVWNAVANNTGQDVTRKDPRIVWVAPDEPTWYPQTTKDKIPNVVVTDSVLVAGSGRGWRVEEGPLWPQLSDILLRGDLGIRCIRPRDGGSDAKVVTVDPDQYINRGVITRTWTTGITQLRFDIYDGVDRTTGENAVVFNVNSGDIDKYQYLFSGKDYKTAVEIMSSLNGQDDVYRNAEQQAWTGFQRRVTSFDGGSPEYPNEPEEPDKPDKNATQHEQDVYADDYADWLAKHKAWKQRVQEIKDKFIADNQDEGHKILKKSRRQSLFTGDASPLAPFKYKTDYDLGDKVTLQGGYGEAQNMIVTEYVRTEDADGDRGYPGLALP